MTLSSTPVSENRPHTESYKVSFCVFLRGRNPGYLSNANMREVIQLFAQNFGWIAALELAFGSEGVKNFTRRFLVERS